MTDHADNPIVRLWHAAWLVRDPDTLATLVADPYVRHGREGTTRMAPTEFAAQVVKSLGHLKGTELSVDDLATVGDMVYGRVRMKGIDLGTGNPVTISWLGHFRIENGVVAESWMLHQTDLDWE